MPRYDLQALLAVKPNAHIELDRFSDQAFSNNLVRTGVLAEHCVNQPRNASGPSRRAVMAPPGPSSQSAVRQQNTSPAPPDAQFNDAFVRFVEQHTSPKPQRVTAGGRIVPMNPWDSPPKWSLPIGTKSTSAPNSDASKPGPRSEAMSRSENRPRYQTLSVSGSKVAKASLPADAAAAPCFQPLASHSAAPPSASIPPTNQQFQGPGLSGLPTYPPLGMGGDSFINAFAQLPTSPQLMSAQGPMFSFQPQPAPPVTPTLPSWINMSTPTLAPYGPYQPGYGPGPSATGTQWPQQWPPAIGNPLSAHNQPPVPPYFQEVIYQKSLEDATRQHEALSAQLSQIDRFTAMNGWVIDPETKKSLVEQRKSLVREMDTVRLYKEHLHVLYGKLQMTSTSVAKEMIAVPVTPSRNDGWETPTKSKSRSLSPTVRNLYRRIEESDERGEPIAGLLHALSGASKGLAKRLSHERRTSLCLSTEETGREISRRMSREASQSREMSRELSREGSREVSRELSRELTREMSRELFREMSREMSRELSRETSNALIKNDAPSQEVETVQYMHPVHLSRRLWQSDPLPHSPLLSQWFSKDWNLVVQKTAAPAVSQNVNAHAFVPSLDGSGKTADGFELV